MTFPSKTSFRVLSDLGISGFGLQVLRGISRYQSLHTGLLISSCSISQLRNIPDQNDILGVIGHFFHEHHYSGLALKDIPHVITVSNRAKNIPFPGVQHLLMDDRAVGEMAASYFIRKGFRQFALVRIRGGGHFNFSDQRSEGYIQTLEREGFKHVLQFFTPDLIKVNPAELPVPLAMFVVSDGNAANAMNKLIRNGASIPRDIAVLGVDNDETVAPFCPVPLSSIKLPWEKVGYDACEELYKRMSGAAGYEQVRYYSPLKVVERLSTGDMSADDHYIRRAQSLIEENLPELKDVQQLSELLHTSRRTLDRKFHQHLGRTATSWLSMKRVNLALRLLRETEHSVERIAELAGFGSRQTLYDAFKREGKPMPTTYRHDPDTL